MKKIMTWVAIAAVLGVDGFMQDQSDSSVSFLGEHMDKLNAKLTSDAAALAGVADQTAAIEALTTRAETAEAALVEASRLHNEAVASLATANTTLATRTAELAAANLKLSKKPAAEATVVDVGGGGNTTKIKANEMDFQKKLYAALGQYGTAPKKATT